MNIKKLSPNILSNNNFAINLTEFTAGDTKTAEYYIDLYAKNRLPSLMSGRTSYNLQSFRTDLEFLSRKMEAVRKTLSIWESYRIADVAFNRDELESKLGALPPNSGLVVNFEADDLTIGGKQYSQGDVIFTDYIGNQYILKSFSGGYYYPYKFEQVSLDTPGVYRISYAYTTAAPVPDTITLENETLQTPYEQIQIELEEADTKDRYTQSQLLGPHGSETSKVCIPALYTTIDKYEEPTQVLVRPIVAWYLADQENTDIKTDRIYFDLEWSYDETTKEIIIENPINLYCWCEVR